MGNAYTVRIQLCNTFLKVKKFNSNPNYLLNLSQAALVLGYKDYRKIESFINEGLLKAYKMPHTKRIKVRYHDVMNLPNESI